MSKEVERRYATINEVLALYPISRNALSVYLRKYPEFRRRCYRQFGSKPMYIITEIEKFLDEGGFDGVEPIDNDDEDC